MTSGIRTQTADFSWNPLVAIADDAHARALARGGVWAAGLLVLSYALVLANAVNAATLVTVALVACVAGALAWGLSARASAIAAGPLLLWVVVETAGDLWLAVTAFSVTQGLNALVDLFSLVLAIQAWRGSIALRRATPAA
ncbi:hypothetical protein [Caulobacter sp. 17J80-11]|uniref:hypothetical protein n=1 Tax=Caulobacter sp. 17J80-11 TaxID=2763502 RepID=UPI0016536F08|nr:hypothetical protein [Caulobacter sp. 17J80-11]MBC6980488.1 hypothetical protein [Caulobacter sp. 17J80-11]